MRDPELDESVTTLGFVASCTVSPGGQATVRLRLPTYFCAPNFAYLMVADAYDAVTAVPGVACAEVILEDHFASDAINAGVAARAGFAASFAGEALAELDELRAAFLRKAVLAGTDQVGRPLWPPGHAGRCGADPRRRSRLARAGPACGGAAPTWGCPRDDAPLLIDPATGAAISDEAVPLHLRRASVTRAGIEANTSICSGMFRHRYPTS